MSRRRREGATTLPSFAAAVRRQRTVAVAKAVAEKLLRSSHGVVDFSGRSVALHSDTWVLKCATALRHGKEENEPDRNADDVHSH
jgi:hypothetical protein